MIAKKETRVKVNKVKYVYVLFERPMKWWPGKWKAIEVLPDDHTILTARLSFLRDDEFLQERRYEVKAERVVWRG